MSKDKKSPYIKSGESLNPNIVIYSFLPCHRKTEKNEELRRLGVDIVCQHQDDVSDS